MSFVVFSGQSFRSVLRVLTATGLVISLGGYQSRVVDQCYRLPIVARMADPGYFPNDAFVKAFDTFNPHFGYAKLLIAGTSVIGLSLTLLLLHAATIGLTIAAIWRIRRSLWPALPPWSEWLLVAAFALCRTGNIGTNHLWEDHLLDRQIGFALLWISLAAWLGGGSRRTCAIAACVGVTSLVHPGLGLLTAALWGGVAAVSAMFGVTSRRESLRFVGLLVIAMIPWAVLYAPQSKVLKAGVDPELFWSLSTELQGPQHMRPVHWRGSQWWAAAALLTAGSVAAWTHARQADRNAGVRVGIWAGLIVAGLGVAVPLIEIVHDLNVTLSQPFRLATPLRGLCLILMTPHLVRLISEGGPLGAVRVSGLMIALRSDRAFTAAVIVEGAMLLVERIVKRTSSQIVREYASPISFALSAVAAVWWLIRHDTADGETLLAAGYGLGLVASVVVRKVSGGDEGSFLASITSIGNARFCRICVYAWSPVLLSVVIGGYDPMGETSTAKLFAGRWRVYETPLTDMETLAAGSRSFLPPDALVLTPPRDKAFRQWSRRSVVVNVAGSPYQASALKDWAERLRELAGEPCDLLRFAQEWPANRVPWETYYEIASAKEIVGWAEQFSATAIVTLQRGEEPIDLTPHGWKQFASYGSARLWVKSAEAVALDGP